MPPPPPGIGVGGRSKPYSKWRFILAVLSLCVVQTIFGGYAVLTSVAFHSTQVSALVFAMCRDVIGSAVLLTAAWFVERRAGAKGRFFIAYEDVGYFILLGWLGVWGAQGMSALAIKFTTATFFAQSTPIQPVVALLLSILIKEERFKVREWQSWGKLTGIGVSITGAIVLVTFSSSAGSSVRTDSANLPLGIVFIALQLLLGGSFPVAQKRMLHRYSPIVAIAWSYALGTWLLLLSVATAATDASCWAFDTTTILAVLYAGVLSSATAYFLMSWVNKHTSPVMVAAFAPGQAVMAAVFAWAFQGKAFIITDYLGGFGVVIGLFIMLLSQYCESIRLAAIAEVKQRIKKGHDAAKLGMHAPPGTAEYAVTLYGNGDDDDDDDGGGGGGGMEGEGEVASVTERSGTEDSSGLDGAGTQPLLQGANVDGRWASVNGVRPGGAVLLPGR